MFVSGSSNFIGLAVIFHKFPGTQFGQYCFKKKI